MCVSLVFVVFLVQISALPQYRIGGIFDLSRGDLEDAFNLALNMENDGTSFHLEGLTMRIPTSDALTVSKAACTLLENGVISIIGPSFLRTSNYVQSLCDSKDIPHLETHWDKNQLVGNCLVNVHPHPQTIEAMFIDILRAWKWEKFTILYHNNEDLSKIHDILAYGNGDVTVKLAQIYQDEYGGYRSMLNGLKLSGEGHFVIVCSLDVLEKFLHQAQQIGLITQHQHYILYNLDVHSIDLEPYQYGGCNITGVRIVNPTAADIAVHLQTPVVLDVALTMDAVKLFYKTVKGLHSTSQLSGQPLSCNSTDIWEDGLTFINNMRLKRIKGITGHLQFDMDGFRSEIEVDLMELTSSGFVKIGTWTTRDGVWIDRKAVQQKVKADRGSSIKNKTFYVITALTPPYGMLKETTTKLSGNDRFEGFGIDVIEELSKMLGFNYTIIIQEDGANGNMDKNGKWNGMIGAITNGQADFAIGDLTITSEREKAVDFTMPFMMLGISILYRKPEPVPPSLFMFASPFSGKVWLLLGVAYVSVSVSLFVIGRICPSEWTNPYPCVEQPKFLVNQLSLRNSLWFTVGSLMQQGTEIAPIGISTRMIAGIWWFFTLIMVSSYTANLAAFLTVETLVTPFKTVDELAKQTEIKYGAKADGATANFFENTKIGGYMRMNRHLMTSTNEEGIKRVENENYAFLMESTSIEYAVERHCSLAQVGNLLDEKGYGIAMRKNSSYRFVLSTSILRLQENGMLTNLKIKWWKEKRGGGICMKRTAAATPLTLQNVGGVFLVLAIGALLGILSTFAELGTHTYRRSRAENVKFKNEMNDELHFFAKFKNNTKPTRKLNVEVDDNQSYSTR